MVGRPSLYNRSSIHANEAGFLKFFNSLTFTVGYGKFGFKKFGVFFKSRNSDSKISESKKRSVGKFGVESHQFSKNSLILTHVRTFLYPVMSYFESH